MLTDTLPKSEVLRKHILNFNMFEKSKDFNLHFFAFPQFGSTIELFKNTKVKRTSSGITLTPIKNSHNKNTCSIEILGKYSEPVFYYFEGFADGFAINFNPVGINYFFEKSYKKIAPKNFQEFSDLKWNKFAEELFEIKSFEKRVEFAEAFFESILTKPNINDIEKAIEAILKDETIHINELADICCTSTRNLLRRFNQYVGCSPTVYKRIVRFRKSIDFSIWKEQNLNCTDICYNNNFYDIAHFRKEFLKLTHQNPVDFFKTISVSGKNHKFPFRIF